MISTYFAGCTQNKTALLTYFIDDRFVKELIKVFFTLLAKLQFVDIVKCI